METEKLIITVTIAPSWIYPDVGNAPTTPEEVADTVYECWKAGASIAHIHGAEPWTLKVWRKAVGLIRDKCDIIVQIGLSALPLEQRRDLFNLKPDMMSIILSHHDECFTATELNLLHPRDEIEEYCKVFRERGIKPEFEVWHFGSIWNLNYLIKKGVVEKPYFITQFFGWPGGTWSPPTPEELLHRVRNQPKDCIYSVSIMDQAQTRLATLSIILGGHVRVGTEDNPYYEEGVLAKGNPQLVARMARIARELGREIAKPDEAREMIGIRRS